MVYTMTIILNTDLPNSNAVGVTVHRALEDAGLVFHSVKDVAALKEGKAHSSQPEAVGVDSQQLKDAISTVEQAAIKRKMSQITYDELMSLLESVLKQTPIS